MIFLSAWGFFVWSWILSLCKLDRPHVITTKCYWAAGPAYFFHMSTILALLLPCLGHKGAPGLGWFRPSCHLCSFSNHIKAARRCILKEPRRLCDYRRLSSVPPQPGQPSFFDYWGGLPPLLQGDFFESQGEQGALESGSIVRCLNSQAREVLGTGGPLHTWSNTLKRHQGQMRGGDKEVVKKGRLFMVRMLIYWKQTQFSLWTVYTNIGSKILLCFYLRECSCSSVLWVQSYNKWRFHRSWTSCICNKKIFNLSLLHLAHHACGCRLQMGSKAL